ncbi:MAG: hypothetical protein RI973_1929 [Bacteroidota bacterium]|jgi:hypothetical protein
MSSDLARFTGKTALYLFLFSLPILGLEIMLRQPGSDSYAFKKHLIEETLADNEVLIIGNSLAWSGINPDSLGPNCINVANFEQAFYSDYKILEKYLPQSPRLKTVIMPVSVETCFSKPNQRSEQSYSAYWGIVPHDKVRKLEHYSAVMIYGFWPGIKKLFEAGEETNGRGWGSTTVAYQYDPAAVEEKMQRIRSLLAEDNFQESKADLQRIVNICRENQVRLILYIPPFTQGLSRELEAHPDYQLMLDFLDGISRQGGAEVLDLRNDSLFADHLFRDVNHLNVEGAKVLSGLIAKAVRQPISAVK